MQKPFDILIIESPYEYSGDFEKKLKHFGKLSEICKHHNIPIRVPNGSVPLRDSNGPRQDHLVAPFFRECDYLPQLYYEEIQRLEKVRVLLTGGLFNLVPEVIYFRHNSPEVFARPLEEVLVQETGLDRSRVKNMDLNDTSRNLGIYHGCVPEQAFQLIQRLKESIRSIKIDGKSVASHNDLKEDKLYEIITASQTYTGFTYVIAQETLRNENQ